MQKSLAKMLGIVAILSFGCMTSRNHLDDLYFKKAKRLENVVREPVLFALLGQTNDASKVYELINSSGDLVKYELNEGRTNRQVFIKGFNINELNMDHSGHVDRICSLYFDFVRKEDKYLVFDQEGKFVIAGNEITRSNEFIYARTRDQVEKVKYVADW